MKRIADRNPQTRFGYDLSLDLVPPKIARLCRPLTQRGTGMHKLRLGLLYTLLAGLLILLPVSASIATGKVGLP